jgi:hypothetical protein
MTADADHMREICARGRGSRGGKGARKRRNGRKRSTRRLSIDEQEAEAIRLKTLEESLLGTVEAEQEQKATSVLESYFSDLSFTTPASMWSSISKGSLKRFVIKGDEQHRKALDLVIALKTKVVASQKIETHCRLIEEKLAEQRPADPTGKARKAKIATEDDLVRGIARLTIDFGKSGQSDTKKVSRFVAAVRFLIAAGVGPGGVEKYYEENGGGLDEWHRSAEGAKAARKTRLAAAAWAVEAQKSKLDDWDPDDDPPRGPTNWADMEPVKSREEHRLQKLSGVGRWECSLLQYFKWDKKISPSEVMVAIVIGDEEQPSEVRLVESFSLGEIFGSPTFRILQLNKIVAGIKKLSGST